MSPASVLAGSGHVNKMARRAEAATAPCSDHRRMHARYVDGLTIRPLRNGDVETVAALFERLGPTSRAQRFGGAKPRSGARELALLARVDADRTRSSATSTATPPRPRWRSSSASARARRSRSPSPTSTRAAGSARRSRGSSRPTRPRPRSRSCGSPSRATTPAPSRSCAGSPARCASGGSAAASASSCCVSPDGRATACPREADRTGIHLRAARRPHSRCVLMGTHRHSTRERNPRCSTTWQQRSQAPPSAGCTTRRATTAVCGAAVARRRASFRSAAPAQPRVSTAGLAPQC